MIKMIKNDVAAKPKIIDNNVESQTLDGGWGWIVCIAAFLANFIADGTMLSSGVQMLAFLDYFGETKAKTSWVSSSQLGLSMMFGPVVSYLIAKYSVRSVTIAGGVIAFLGAVGGAFSPNLYVLIVTYGVICGTGICLFFISSIVAVGLYFSKKRAIATGIAMSGSGIGVIVYPYLTEVLLNVYDWRNTMMIVAAICLNACVCGSLFRSIKKRTEKSNTCACLEGNSIPDSDDNKSMVSYDYLKVELIPSAKMYNSASQIDGKYFSFVDLNKNKMFYDRQFHSELHLSSQKYNDIHSTVSNNFLAPALQSDVFYSGSINVIPAFETEIECLNDANVAHENESENNKTTFNICVCLLKQPSFLLLLCCMIMWTAQGITMTYVPDMAVSKGISRYDSAALISIIGVTNTVVRIVAGFIVDVFHIRTLHLYIGALCLGAVSNVAFPWCHSFPLLAVCAVGFGLCMGTVVCLRTILIADTLGIDQLTQAFGIIAFFQGMAFTINPPIAGFIFDVSGSYVYPFLMVGGLYTIAAVVCCVLLCTHQHRRPEDTVIDIEESDDKDVIKADVQMA